MTGEMVLVAVVAVVGALVGVACARWLRSHGHRYEDERHLPARRTGWVVLACTVLPVLALLARPSEPVAVVHAMTTVVLVVLAAIDLDVFRLPDMITGPLAVGLVAALLAASLVGGDVGPWVRALLAGLALGAFYLALVLVGGGSGMGLGDAKLAPSLGMLLGFQSWAHVLLGTMVSVLLAGVAALYLVLFRGAGRTSHLAFGPYLVAGTVLVVIAPSLGRL